MTNEKIYAVGGLAIVAIIISLAYNPTSNMTIPTYNFEEIVSDELKNNDQYIISTYQNSEQWEWIKKQVINAEESDKILALENRISTLGQQITLLDNKVKQTETSTKSTTKDIKSLYTADNDGNPEDRFNQGDIVYFYLTPNTNEPYLYYSIVNDDTNNEVKDKRISISDGNSQKVWAWVIPNNQIDGDYYIEIDIGNSNKKVYFDIR
jgi:hypothetical protein